VSVEIDWVYRVGADPPIADQGGCFRCGRERLPVAVKHADPFCSTVCCRGWHAPRARRARAWWWGSVGNRQAREGSSVA
jgi:hypothetical protein